MRSDMPRVTVSRVTSKRKKARVRSQQGKIKSDFSLELLIKICYLTLTLLDFQILARKLLPFATIEHLAILYLIISLARKHPQLN